MSEAVQNAIRSSIAAAESASPSSGSEPTGETTTETGSTAEPVVAESTVTTEPVVSADGEPVVAKVGEPAKEAVKPVVEVDEFAKEHGIKSKKADGRDNPIPYSAVRDRIVPNAVKKAEATWTTEKLQPVVAERDRLVAKVNDIAQTEHILFNDQKRFIEILRTIPGYAELLSNTGNTAVTGKSAAPGDLPDAVNDPRPGPDYMDPTTGKPAGYTPEGHEKLLDWIARDAERRALARMEKQYGPIKDAFDRTQKSRKERGELENRTTDVLSQATIWPGFKENFTEIEKVLPTIPDINPETGRRYTAMEALRVAYDKVVPDKLRANEDALRRKILDEMAAAPAGTSTSGETTAKTGEGPAPGESATHYAIRKATADAMRAGVGR